jgi:hypothetical protein
VMYPLGRGCGVASCGYVDADYAGLVLQLSASQAHLPFDIAMGHGTCDGECFRSRVWLSCYFMGPCYCFTCGLCCNVCSTVEVATRLERLVVLFELNERFRTLMSSITGFPMSGGHGANDLCAAADITARSNVMPTVSMQTLATYPDQNISCRGAINRI